jgi:hypothetical protein
MASQLFKSAKVLAVISGEMPPDARTRACKHAVGLQGAVFTGSHTSALATVICSLLPLHLVPRCIKHGLDLQALLWELSTAPLINYYVGLVVLQFIL